MKPLQPFFKYYGSKYNIVPHYLKPVAQEIIIEPFAGSACYALHYYNKKIILNDKDPLIANLWKYLINVSEREILALPNTVDKEGNQLNRLIPEARHLIGFWLAIGRAKPSSVPSSMILNHTDYGRPNSKDGRVWNERRKRIIAEQLKNIRHWKITNEDYTECPDIEAVWFVDPPYNNKAGQVYTTKFEDFDGLAKWVKTRKGSIIICEQDGADWLEFKELKEYTTCNGRTKSKEVVYYQGNFRVGRVSNGFYFCYPAYKLPIGQ